MNDVSHYQELNDRFDQRYPILRDLGYKYQRVESLGFAVFSRDRGLVSNRNIPAATVLWQDLIERVSEQ